MEFKIVEIERERRRRVCGGSIYGLARPSLAAHKAAEAHDFVLVFIYLEAEVGRERRIQHAKGMRKPDFR